MMIVIDGGVFCVGVEIENGFIVEAPPIVRYLKGKTQNWLLNYARIKGWKLVYSQ